MRFALKELAFPCVDLGLNVSLPLKEKEEKAPVIEEKV
jgi:hypothetical protein